MMSIFEKTIFTGFSPNLTAKSVRTALSWLLLPWKWRKINSGEKVVLAEESLRKYFNVEHASAFDSGRSALLHALKSMDVATGDEVLVQGYTCMVVVNAIVQSGANPVFVDVNDDLNMSVTDLEKKISAKSKVLIIQHTFGLAADVEKMMEIARKNNLLVIEDCAHSLGAMHGDKLLGTIGDIGMFSFGADKILSCVRGGALITNDKKFAEKIELLKKQLPAPKKLKTVQHLMHLPVFHFGKKFYHLYLGKMLLFAAQKLGLINKIIYDQEKRGEVVDFYPSTLANSLADILIDQISEVDAINKHRQEIAHFYDKNIKNERIELIWNKEKIKNDDCVYLRYPVMIEKPGKLLAFAKKRGVILGNWYDAVVAPADVDFGKTKYGIGSCPNAEIFAKKSANLPTDRHISIRDAEKIAAIINQY